MAIFTVSSYLSESQKHVDITTLRYVNVLSLWLIFSAVYCLLLSAEKIDECRYLCEEFVKPTAQITPQYLHRLKTHLLLHLTDHLCDFGAANCYNTEK